MLHKTNQDTDEKATDTIERDLDTDVREDLSSAIDWERPPQSARDALERFRLKRALSETNGTVTDVASLWEVTKRAVYKMCYKHDLDPRDFQPDDES